jgi:hypothetical protein
MSDTAPITSARVRELIAAIDASADFDVADAVGDFQTELLKHVDHIAKALSLLERVQAGDAGLVEAMIEAAGWALFGNYEPGSDDPFRVAEEVLRAAFSAQETHLPRELTRLRARVAELEGACENAHAALESARAFILKKHGSTNPAREASIEELRRILIARQVLGGSDGR